jgi:SpoVK/Ycf46/Vps4 family AAA+-type ATPase
MKQIALPLDKLRSGGPDSLIVTSSNADAIAALGASDRWPGHCAILAGPPRSGKSLMARYFAGQGGDAVDDADALDDEALFHRWNAARNDGIALLLVSTKLPSDWDVALPDLRSRLASSQLIELAEPDEELINHLILKHLRDRGTSIGPEALSYAVRRIERTYAAIEAFARDANQLALAEGSAITLPLVRRLF